MTEQTAVGFRSERGPVLIALMLSTGLVAIEATILATAVPSIVADIGGFSQFPWLFSIFLLAQAVSVPVYSKLADTVGRKPIMLVGIGAFLVGSILCGVAWDMTSLIVFRAVQGLGAGAVLPVSITITGDIYTVRERARVQGYIASVWAASSVIGPSLGGLFAEFLSWRWIFFVNIPLCFIAAWMLIRNYHETVERKKHRIDIAGRRGAHGRADAADPRRARGRAGVGRGTRGRASARSRSAAVLLVGVRAHRAARGGAGAAAVAVLATAHRHDVAHLVRRRRRPHRPHVVRADVPRDLRGRDARSSRASRSRRSPSGGRSRRRSRAASSCASDSAAPPSSGSASPCSAPSGLFAASLVPNPWTTAIACFVVGLGLGLVASPTLIAAQSSVPWARARRGHRREHVPALDGQRRRRRDLRRDRERRDRGLGTRRAVPRRDPGGLEHGVPRGDRRDGRDHRRGGARCRAGMSTTSSTARPRSRPRAQPWRRERLDPRSRGPRARSRPQPAAR